MSRSSPSRWERMRLEVYHSCNLWTADCSGTGKALSRINRSYHVPHTMADYTRPKPVDPIRYQPNGRLRIECRCGRIAIFKLSDFAQARQLDGSMQIYAMIARLRCAACGNRPKFAEVSKPTRGFVENYWGTGRAERALWPRSRDR